MTLFPTKNWVTVEPTHGRISVVTRKRTDTTLDHSQKAEKVCVLREAKNPESKDYA